MQCYVVQNNAKDVTFCEYLYVIIWPCQKDLIRASCFPILVPEDTNDPFWKANRKCIHFVRSKNTPTLNCDLDAPRQQVIS